VVYVELVLWDSCVAAADLGGLNTPPQQKLYPLPGKDNISRAQHASETLRVPITSIKTVVTRSREAQRDIKRQVKCLVPHAWENACVSKRKLKSKVRK
jgi:hypothetical protein